MRLSELGGFLAIVSFSRSIFPINSISFSGYFSSMRCTFLLSSYRLVSTGVAADTFYVDPSDGTVILRKSVTAGDRYTLQIEATDGGSPALVGTAYVTINVIGSQGDLVFGKCCS